MEVMSFVLTWLAMLLSPLEPGGELALEPLTAARGTQLVSEEFRVVEAAPTPGTTFVVLESDSYFLSRMAGAGRLGWRLPLHAEPSQLLSVGEGLLALGTSDGGVVVVDANGTVLFSGKLPSGGAVSLALVERSAVEDEDAPANLLVALGREVGAVLPLNFSDDGLLFTLPAKPTTPAVALGETITYGDAEGITTLNTEGEVLWRYPLFGSVRIPPVISGGLVYFAAGDNRLYGLQQDNAAAPLVEYLELGVPPTALYPLPQGGLAVGTAEGSLLFIQDGEIQSELKLTTAPQPGYALRGSELVFVAGRDELFAVELDGTPFAAEEPGFNPTEVGWSYRHLAGFTSSPKLFQPASGVNPTKREQAQLGIYLTGGDGELLVISRGITL